MHDAPYNVPQLLKVSFQVYYLIIKKKVKYCLDQQKYRTICTFLLFIELFWSYFRGIKLQVEDINSKQYLSDLFARG